MLSRGTTLGLAILALPLALWLPFAVRGQEPTDEVGSEVAGQVTPAPVDEAEEPPPAAPGARPGGPGPTTGGYASNFCEVNELMLSRSLALQHEEVGWRATGLMPGSRVSPRVVEVLAPTGASVTQLVSALVTNQCEATGTFLASDLGTGTFSFTITGTAPRGGTVEFAAAFSVVASSRPPAPTATPRVLPAAPGGVRASALNHNTVRVEWADNAHNETGFRIDSDAGQFRTPANMTTYNVGGLQPQTVYCFSVYAFNDAGESFGGTSCAFTPAPPPR